MCPSPENKLFLDLNFLGNLWRICALYQLTSKMEQSSFSSIEMCLKQAQLFYENSEWGLALTHSLLAQLHKDNSKLA